MSKKNTISVTCTGSDTLPFDRLEEFQGNLKKRSKKEIDKIIKSINRYGFSFPFFVWNGTGHNYVLDGHGRISALSEMRQKGYNLPLFPVVYIEAKDEAEAKLKLLQANSHYGTITSEGLENFISDIDIDLDDFELGIKDIDIDAGFNSDPKEAKYKSKCVIDDFPKMDSTELFNILSSVGFSSPPSWLKPYSVLSNGEKMRVDLARAICEKKDIICFDEFTSVVDREVAQLPKIG